LNFDQLLPALAAAALPFFLHVRFFEFMLSAEVDRVVERSTWTAPDGDPQEAKIYYDPKTMLRSRLGQIYKTSGGVCSVCGFVVGFSQSQSAISSVFAIGFFGGLFAAYFCLYRYISNGP
jgi:hypothetical protein